MTEGYTIGYEGQTAEEIIDKLKKNEVQVVFDVRHRAQSRKKGLSKSSLSSALNSAGIEYHHDKIWGTPPEITITPGCMGDYDPKDYKNWIKMHPEIIGKMRNLAYGKRFAMLCYESNWIDCHRKYLAEELSVDMNINFKHI